MFKTIVAISLGAAIGALLRYLLTLSINPFFSTINAGIIISNLIGGYLVGVVLYIISIYPEISEIWKLFIITGLLGSLTTFSAFSAEVFNLIQANKWPQAMIVISFHLIGSILMTALGFVSAVFIKKII